MTSRDQTTTPNNLMVYLVATYIAAELVSNATAGRLVQIGNFVFPGAIFLFSLTFTLRDAIHTLGGWNAAKTLVGAGITANLILSLYGLLVTTLPHPGFFDPTPYNTVFGSTTRVVAASLTAYILSTLLDALVFERMKQSSITARVLISNLISTTIDTGVFITLAFAGTGAPLLNLMVGQVILKMLISVILIPLVYWVKSKSPTAHT